MRIGLLATVLAFFLVSPGAQAAETDKAGVDWQPWSAGVFARAKAENRLVLLNMEAVWCHWCHVMDEVTYADPDVRTLLKDHYIAVRVDQDANPDLGVRYGDWGWPATIVLSGDGEELGKYRGFIPPRAMAGELYAYSQNPTPGPSVTGEVQITPSPSLFLSEEQRGKILEIYNATYDEEFGAWGRALKFIQADTLEYAMQRSREGNEDAGRQARQTLDAARQLVDPVWGGVFQYSDKRDWSSPHFEKIMAVQRDYLKLYSAGFTLYGDDAYRQTAYDVFRYLSDFMTSPDGAFHTSQDADVVGGLSGAEFYALDDAARRANGKMPRIDRALYARENGWVVSGLVALYKATGDAAVLSSAERAAKWVLANRSLDGGGFSHDETDRGGPFLGDTLAMGRAALDLYQATGERKWLGVATAAAGFIDIHFRDGVTGFDTTAAPAAQSGVFAQPFRNIEENVDLARFANALHRNTGQERYRDIAGHAMGFLTSEAVTGKRRFLTGIISADEELAIEPAHVTVIGAKSDPAAQALYAASLALPLGYLRIEWWDRKEGLLPNPDVEFPELAKAAVFACANQICSLPLNDADGLLETVRGMMSARVAKR